MIIKSIDLIDLIFFDAIIPVTPMVFRERLQSVLTKKGKYGLKAMVHLGAIWVRPRGRPDSRHRNRFKRQKIPKKFLDAILWELPNAGFVNSKMGKGGGYMLARTASPRDQCRRNHSSHRRPAGAFCLVRARRVISAATIAWTRRNAPSDW